MLARSLGWGLVALLLGSVTLPDTATAQIAIANSISLGGFQSQQELETCWNHLNASAVNGRVYSNEYVTFAKLSSPPGLLNGVNTFNQLPLSFKAAFSFTACLCRQPNFGGNASDPQCCYGANGFVRVPVNPNNHPNAYDQAYLVATCAYVQAAATQTASGSPSPSPPPFHTLTPRPSTAPPHHTGTDPASDPRTDHLGSHRFTH